MDDDFSEFCTRLGTDVPVYRECPQCGDLIIVNPGDYGKPKLECDPDRIDDCSYWLPVCPCRKNQPLYTWESLGECTWPDCDCSQNDA